MGLGFPPQNLAPSSLPVMRPEEAEEEEVVVVVEDDDDNEEEDRERIRGKERDRAGWDRRGIQAPEEEEKKKKVVVVVVGGSLSFSLSLSLCLPVCGGSGKCRRAG